VVLLSRTATARTEAQNRRQQRENVAEERNRIDRRLCGLRKRVKIKLSIRTRIETIGIDIADDADDRAYDG